MNMTCRHCTNWNMRQIPKMGEQGFGTCNLQVSKAVSYPPHHTCSAFKPLPADQAAKRDKYLAGVGL